MVRTVGVLGAQWCMEAEEQEEPVEEQAGDDEDAGEAEDDMTAGFLYHSLFGGGSRPRIVKPKSSLTDDCFHHFYFRSMDHSLTHRPLASDARMIPSSFTCFWTKKNKLCHELF